MGDGREIGGRHSTILSLSFINNDFLLRNIPYQSPDHTFPFATFYESDSRDNLEMNIKPDNFVERLIHKGCKSTDSTNKKLYLSGDEMFLIKILNGSKELSPTSECGWNLYHYASKEQKREVAVSGLRTDIEVLVDRKHPESLIPSVPLDHIVFDTLHGLTRIVEKLISLEVEKIMSEENKNQQKPASLPSSKQLIANLVSNINKRGIRQGNFQIHFDKAGKLEPITLNKDHALGIISPPPTGRETDFPPVIEKVVSSRPIPPSILSEIAPYIKNTKADITVIEYDVVSNIWNSLYEMYVVLKTEPEPELLKGKLEGSLHPEDYTWGYNDTTKLMYKENAERFYKLFCSRFTWQRLTPYMIKFKDYARFFMENLDFPMCRFQAEGGELQPQSALSPTYHKTWWEK